MQTHYSISQSFISNIPQILDEGKIALWEIDQDKKELHIWGKAYLQTFFGINGAELTLSLDEFMRTYCHPSEQQRVCLQYRRAVADGEAYHSRFQIRNQITKAYRWHRCFANSFCVDKKLYLRGAAEDIQSQIDVETVYAELQEVDERTQMVLDATPLSCVLWNENLDIIDCNREALLLFRLAGKQDMISNFHRLFPPNQPDGTPSFDTVRSRVRRAFRTGRESFEWMHRTLDGSLIPAHVTLVRMQWRGKWIVASYARDLREQKSHLAQIEQTYQELMHARDAAEESARAKSEFLANMSHELRTPMNAILGMTELLLRSELSVQQKFYLQKADQSARYLLRIVNDILDFSKIEAGKLEMEQAAFSIVEILRTASELMQEELNGKDLDVAIHISPDVPGRLCGDALRLNQVLINLLSNAVKFTTRGSITVAVKKEKQDETFVELQFSVADTGIGLTPEQVARLFTPFTQGDASTTRKYGGSGLGLAICRSIVEQMGGTIWCESRPGEGATFFFTARFALEIDSPPPTADGESGTIPEAVRGSHILLVEDNEINRILAKELLIMEHFHVDMAVNGKQALRMLQEKRYDLVLMDIQMPEMDGLTATRAIRADPALQDLPIVAMTAHAVNTELQKSLEAGMNDHVTKPIEPQRLYHALVKWIRPREQEGSDTEQPDSVYIDVQSALERLGVSPPLMKKMLSVLSKNLPVEQLLAELERGDKEALAQTVHGIKGVAANLSLPAVHTQSVQIETHLREGVLPDRLLRELAETMRETLRRAQQVEATL